MQFNWKDTELNSDSKETTVLLAIKLLEATISSKQTFIVSNSFTEFHCLVHSIKMVIMILNFKNAFLLFKLIETPRSRGKVEDDGIQLCHRCSMNQTPSEITWLFPFVL